MFEYEIKGITLTMDDMAEIHKYYEVCCTAEFLMENYELTEEKAMSLGYNVRMLMDKYDYTESEAIKELKEELK